MSFKENSSQCFQILVLSFRQRVEIFNIACQGMTACPAGWIFFGATGLLEYCCGKSSLWVTCHTPVKPTRRCWSLSLAEGGWILPKTVQGLCEYLQEVRMWRSGEIRAGFCRRTLWSCKVHLQFVKFSFFSHATQKMCLRCIQRTVHEHHLESASSATFDRGFIMKACIMHWYDETFFVNSPTFKSFCNIQL